MQPTGQREASVTLQEKWGGQLLPPLPHTSKCRVRHNVPHIPFLTILFCPFPCHITFLNLFFY